MELHRGNANFITGSSNKVSFLIRCWWGSRSLLFPHCVAEIPENLNIEWFILYIYAHEGGNYSESAWNFSHWRFVCCSVFSLDGFSFLVTMKCEGCFFLKAISYKFVNIQWMLCEFWWTNGADTEYETFNRYDRFLATISSYFKEYDEPQQICIFEGHCDSITYICIYTHPSIM